jgi:hypothetical protein
MGKGGLRGVFIHFNAGAGEPVPWAGGAGAHATFLIVAVVIYRILLVFVGTRAIQNAFGFFLPVWSTWCRASWGSR